MDHRAHHEAIEVLDECVAEQLLIGIARHSDGLARFGRDRNDRIQQAAGSRRQADRNLVDGHRPEDVGEVVDRAEHRPRDHPLLGLASVALDATSAIDAIGGNRQGVR